MWKKLDKISDRSLSLGVGILSLLSVLLLFLPIVLFGIFAVVHQGEIRYSQLEVARVEKILQNEEARLDSTLQDWSSWDDTYQFVQDGNQTYIDNNLSGQSFNALDIDIFLVINFSNKIMYSKYVNQISRTGTALSFDLQNLLQKYPTLLTHQDIQSGQKGITLIPGYPMLIASRAILTSTSAGPAQGTLIFIRLLDSTEQGALSQLGMRKLGVSSLDYPPSGLPADLPNVSVLKDQVFIQARNFYTIVGYKYLADLNGQPVLLLQVEDPRDLFAQGWTIGIIFSGALLFLGLISSGGAYSFTRSLLSTRKAGRYFERFQTLVHQSSESILLVNADLQILEANPASRELLGWNARQEPAALLKSLLTFEPDLDENYIMELCRSGKTSEHHCARRAGEPLDVELSASLIDAPGIHAFSLILRDVTARKTAEKAQKASEERYMLAAKGANDGLWDWNLVSGEIYYSPRWKAMSGYAEDEINSSPDDWFDRIHPDDLHDFRAKLSDHLAKHSEYFESEYRMLNKAGDYQWMLARGVAVWDPAGFANRIAGSQTDIHERIIFQEQLRFDALHDPLTGLGNRTLIIDHLQHVNERKKRKPDLQFALFFLDLDRFKRINDTLGHQAGDQLLVEAARRLGDGLRSTDTVARFMGSETLARIAGDEFVMLLEDFQSIEDLKKIAERISRLLSAPYNIANQEVSISASIGLVIPEQAYENAEDMIRDADIAMYQAKSLGGGQVVYFNQTMYNRTIERMQLEKDLRKAVERGEFEVYYQPIFTLDNDFIAGFEALVRWNHPEKGLRMPDEFIKAAEETGVIIPLGLFVLEEACQRMQIWLKEARISADMIISVNLSSRQIMSTDLIENVRSILNKTGFDPKKLWLEVTESVLLEKNVLVLRQLNQLRALGIRIEIDDFGTGYSSLSYLQNLPVDGFKIDRSFIKDIQNSGQEIVNTLVDLGHKLGLTHVAEGVETEFQKSYLKGISCDYAQGFLMSKPVSAAAIEVYLKTIKNKGAPG